MYHGIIIDQEFTDKSFPNNFKIFAKKQDGDWGIYGIEIEDLKLDETISKIQANLKTNENWYVHFYNGENLIVIFKNKIFKTSVNSSRWQPIINYGKEIGIPEEQLDFKPNKFEEENSYFDQILL